MTDYFENIAQFNNYPPEQEQKSEELKLIEFGYRSRQDLETALPESLQHLKEDLLLKGKDENNEIKEKPILESKKVLIMPIVNYF
jgi:hypothetical protein